MSKNIELSKNPVRGVFWNINGKIFSFLYKENQYPSGLAKSGNTYVHKKLWKEVKPKGCRQPYNYYPRGRIEINAKGNPIIFMNPHIETHFIPQIMS